MDRSPNVLLIMCDQLFPGVLGCYGGPVPTPHIDRLAAGGVLFENATCPTPFCSPSRASILTGLYPHTHGIVYNVNRRDYPAIPAPTTQEGILQADTTTERLLHAAGYATHHYGKLHLLDEDLPYFADMFTEHDGYVHFMAETFARVRRRPAHEWLDWYGWALPTSVYPPFHAAVERLDGRWDGKPHAPFITKIGRLDLPLEQNFDVLVADRTVEALRRVGDTPFMITCSFNYPHDPNVVPSPYYEMFPPEDLELPSNYHACEPRFHGDWSRQVVSDLGEIAAREFLRIYYASVKLIDDQVGRILDALETTGLASDTLVAFTADHGDMAGGHGMVWKSTSSFYEEVVRIPLIMRLPGRICPGRTEVPACLTDLMPTFLAATGRPLPAVQGHSLLPWITGEADPALAPAFTFCERVTKNPQETREVLCAARGSFMVRGRGWKYLCYVDGDEYLYHLAEDPSEMRNLAAEPAAAATKAELRDHLRSWLQTTEYPGVSPLATGERR